MHGQEYVGVSNMRGKWNELQALFMSDCPYTYYVRCFAYRLQLAFGCCIKSIIAIQQFFSKFTFIVNIVCFFSKRYDELQAFKLDEIAHLLEIDEFENCKVENQIAILKQARDTQSSHFSFICSLINMYDATCSILEKIIVDGFIYS